MKKLLLALALFAAVIAPLNAQTEDEAVIEASKAVVKIRVQGEGFGSGWFVSPTEIITNCHVPWGAKKGTDISALVQREGIVTKIIPIELVTCNTWQDVAIFKTKFNYRHPYVLDHINYLPPKRMEHLWAIGHPHAFPLIIFEGKYQFTAAPVVGAHKCIYSTTPIYPGDSGGPLVRYNHEKHWVEVVGMNTAYWEDHITCAVRTADIMRVYTSRSEDPVDKTVMNKDPIFSPPQFGGPIDPPYTEDE